MIVSTSEDNKIPYHNKVILSFNNLITSIDPGLLECNPIVSGSYAIKYIYSPKSIPNDLDIYFTNQQDFDRALTLLTHKHKNIYETSNAVSFNDISVQLIKKDFLPPEELILNHDLFNVACAITKDKIFTTLETHYSWYNEEICLQNYQIPPNPTKEEKLVALVTLLKRIDKYQDRYQLSLSNSLKKFLHEQKPFLEQNMNLTYSHISEEILLDYYGTPIVDTYFSASTALALLNRLIMESDGFGEWELNQNHWTDEFY